MKPKIVIVGSANTDFVVQVSEIPKTGETVLGGKFITVRGGKGANQAVAAARLGGEVTFIARLGKDQLGDSALIAYESEGIDVRYIARDAAEPSGVALIMVDAAGENIIAVAPGANSRLSPQDVRAAEAAIRSADCILLQLEIPLPTVQAAVELARRHGVRTILNPAPAAELPLELLRQIDLLTPNETEAVRLASGWESMEAGQAATALQEKTGIPTIVVTLGSRGSLIVTGGTSTSVPAFPIHPVDTTGSGDAFNGALAVALARGEAIQQAVRYANAAGALSATRAGAQSSFPKMEELESFMVEAGIA